MDRFDVLADVRSEPPVSIRRSGGRILLAATAAGPVGGDDVALEVVVGPGASADVGSVGALIVWPGPAGLPSTSVTRCVVEPDGHLMWRPEPTVVVAGSDHTAEMTVELAAGATCTVVEEVALGRSGEPGGALALALRVVRDGAPLVHHAERFGPDVPGAGSAVSVGTARHVVAAIVVAPWVGGDVTPAVTTTGGAAAGWMPRGGEVATLLAVGTDRPSAVAAVRRVVPDQLAELW